MMKHGFFLFSLLLLICSCHPEEVDITETGTDTPDSVEVETTKITGTVKNEFNQKISQASIEIYQNGELIKTTNSDASGQFTIDDIEFSTQNYRLFVQKDGYLDKMDIFLTDELENVDHDVFLIAEGFEIGSGQFFPSDTSLIYITGILENNQGPLPGVIMFVSDQDFIFFDYSISDANGRFGFFVKKDDPAHIIYISQCDFDPTMEPLNIGSFSVDTDIGSLLVNVSSPEVVSLSGNISTCSGQPFNGQIYIYNSTQSSSTTSYVNVIDGVFDAEIYICESSDELILDVYNSDIPWGNEQFYVSVSELSNLELAICDTPNPIDHIEVFLDDELVQLTDIVFDIDSSYTLTINAINNENQAPFKLSVSGISETEQNQIVECIVLIHNDVNINTTQANVNHFFSFSEQDFLFGYIEGLVLDANTGLTHHIDISFQFVL